MPPDGADRVRRPDLGHPGALDGHLLADCAPGEGDAGFAVPSGGAVQVKPTIHGDRWVFTNVTRGVEVTERRAQRIADSDLDRNGETTLDELRQVQAADVLPSPTCNLPGALTGAVSTAFDDLEAQADTRSAPSRVRSSG